MVALTKNIHGEWSTSIPHFYMMSIEYYVKRHGTWLKDKASTMSAAGLTIPMTQGKVGAITARLKTHDLLENYLPGQLELSIGEFADYYNNRRYHRGEPGRSEARQRLFR